jgi:hypothetical protein
VYNFVHPWELASAQFYGGYGFYEARQYIWF